MDRRWHLQAKLESILGSTNVYYQPPETIRMQYPCIVYTRRDIETIRADNRNYLSNIRYDITLISRDPDEPVLFDLIQLDKCQYDRHYVSNGLHHDTLTLYY
jgi:hypothetical protein